jgi:hypothetical protein
LADKKRLKIFKTILLTLSISISLILGEVILRFWAGDNIAQRKFELYKSQSTFGSDLPKQQTQFKNLFDNRSKFEVYCDLKKKGITSFPNIHPRDIFKTKKRIQIGEEAIFPLSGIANQHTILCNETGKYIIFKSDKMGFRNPPNTWDSGKIQVALIGDSFTHGNCVPEGDTIAGNIRKKYPRTLNLGRSGNGPLIEYATLKEFLPSQKPQFVFWIYFEGNDLAELGNERKDLFLKKYINSSFSFGLKNYQSEVNSQLKSLVFDHKHESLCTYFNNTDEAPEPDISPRLCSKNFLGCSEGVFFLQGWKYLFQKIWGRTNPHFFRLLPISHPNYKPFHSRDYKPIYELLIPLLGQAKNTVESWGGKLIFVYLPDVTEKKQPRMFANEIKERILEMKVPFVDGNLVFQNEPLKSIRRHHTNGTPFGHYTAKGYSLISQAMLRKISMESPDK